MTDSALPPEEILDRPVVRLTPKAAAQAIRHGFPWVYANELVTDRRTRALPPGTVAVLEDSERRAMGLVGVNPESKIIARMLDADASAEIGEAWFAARLRTALALRERLFAEPFYRLVHAEADGLPGVDALVEALVAVTGVSTVVKNAGGRARSLEGLDDATRVLRGDVTGPVPVRMNGATYLADLTGGQKTGLFYDQRPNHAFAASLAKGSRVLDVFAHVGGFALAALAAGAERALAVDSSAPALELAEAGARATGVAERFATEKGDAFAVMERLGEAGERFGLVVCDPPAFAPSKPALEAGLRAYERVARLAAALVEPGGYLVLCSCSHAADLAKFRTASARGIGRAGRRGQILWTGFAGPDHPQMPQLAESGYLKALAFRLD
jgi:23S rRNA (cytosine1962-C5)-methyltransferase